MTIRARMEAELVSNGLWPAEATEILQRLIDRDVVETMTRRWDDDISGYPVELLAVVLMPVKRYAVEWIDEFKPNHFARFMLTA